MGAGEGAVWVPTAAPDPKLVKVDPVTNRVVATFPLPDQAGGVRAGYGGVWVAQPGSDSVLHIDPATGATAADIHVGRMPRFMAIGEGAVWAMNEADGTVSRIDPATDTVTATIRVSPTRVDGGDIAVGGRRCGRASVTCWSRSRSGHEPGRGPLRTPGGQWQRGGRLTAVWISAHDVDSVWRLALEVP